MPVSFNSQKIDINSCSSKEKALIRDAQGSSRSWFGKSVILHVDKKHPKGVFRSCNFITRLFYSVLQFFHLTKTRVLSKKEVKQLALDLSKTDQKVNKLSPAKSQPKTTTSQRLYQAIHSFTEEIVVISSDDQDIEAGKLTHGYVYMSLFGFEEDSATQTFIFDKSGNVFTTNEPIDIYSLITLSKAGFDATLEDYNSCSQDDKQLKQAEPFITNAASKPVNVKVTATAVKKGPQTVTSQIWTKFHTLSTDQIQTSLDQGAVIDISKADSGILAHTYDEMLEPITILILGKEGPVFCALSYQSSIDPQDPNLIKLKPNDDILQDLLHCVDEAVQIEQYAPEYTDVYDSDYDSCASTHVSDEYSGVHGIDGIGPMNVDQQPVSAVKELYDLVASIPGQKVKTLSQKGVPLDCSIHPETGILTIMTKDKQGQSYGVAVFSNYQLFNSSPHKADNTWIFEWALPIVKHHYQATNMDSVTSKDMSSGAVIHKKPNSLVKELYDLVASSPGQKVVTKSIEGVPVNCSIHPVTGILVVITEDKHGQACSVAVSKDYKVFGLDPNTENSWVFKWVLPIVKHSIPNQAPQPVGQPISVDTYFVEEFYETMLLVKTDKVTFSSTVGKIPYEVLCWRNPNDPTVYLSLAKGPAVDYFCVNQNHEVFKFSSFTHKWEPSPADVWIFQGLTADLNLHLKSNISLLYSSLSPTYHPEDFSPGLSTANSQPALSHKQYDKIFDLHKTFQSFDAEYVSKITIDSIIQELPQNKGYNWKAAYTSSKHNGYYAQKAETAVIAFKGPLSNFQQIPIFDPNTGLTFKSAEHMFHYYKIPPKRKDERDQVFNAKTPKDALLLAGKFMKQDFTDIIKWKMWEKVNKELMVYIQLVKALTPATNLMKALYLSGDAFIIEDTSSRAHTKQPERRWGDNGDGTGENWLGWSQMRARDLLVGTAPVSGTVWQNVDLNHHYKICVKPLLDQYYALLS